MEKLTQTLLDMINSEISADDRSVFERAIELLEKPEILAKALSNQDNPCIQKLVNGDLSELVLEDASETIGRSITDCIIEYVMGVAEEELGVKTSYLH